MAMVESTDWLETEDPGILTDNYRQVKTLQKTLSQSEMDIRIISGGIRLILEDMAWRCWMEPDGTIYRWNAADFRKFIESDRPEGCQTEIASVRKALAGTDAAELFEEAIRGKPGNPDFDSQSRTVEGKFGPLRNRDSITVTESDDHPATIPLSSEAPRPRDYSREAPTGDSVSYALRRLSTNRPDLYERVKAGEISAYRAMILAGFKSEKVSIYLNPEAAIRQLVKHFQGESLEALVRGLANWAGYELVPKE